MLTDVSDLTFISAQFTTRCLESIALISSTSYTKLPDVASPKPSSSSAISQVDMTAPSPPSGVKYAPSPWENLQVETFILSFYSTKLLEDAYAPLEAASSFGDPAVSGAFRGGLGMIQIVRYFSTPVGPYDELLLVPGYFEVPPRAETRARCTRIYVSQKDTCYSGRFNWNIPKHEARFKFEPDHSSGVMTVEVFAPGVDDGAVVEPFFRATLTSTRWLPSFSFSTNVSRLIGMNLNLAQPPLPAASSTQNLLADNEDTEILCGTTEWRIASPEVWGKAKTCWVKVDEPTEANRKGWWPAYQPWSMGLWIKDGFINFRDAPASGK